MDEVSENILKNQACILSEIHVLYDSMIVMRDGHFDYIHRERTKGYEFLDDRYKKTMELYDKNDYNRSALASAMLSNQILILSFMKTLKYDLQSQIKLFPREPKKPSWIVELVIKTVRKLIKEN